MKKLYTIDSGDELCYETFEEAEKAARHKITHGCYNGSSYVISKAAATVCIPAKLVETTPIL